MREDWVERVVEITDEEEEKYKEEFLKLRTFHQAPLRFSHNFGQFELNMERKDQTLKFGKELLPDFDENKIFNIAVKPLPEED